MGIEVADFKRDRILNRFRAVRQEVEQIFTDAAAWNEYVREPDEPEIDPDPFGDLRRLGAALDELLANDPGIGPIAPLRFERSH